MKVLVDQTGEHDVISERVVDDVVGVADLGEHLVDGADGGDALALDGDGTKARRNVFAPPSLVERLDRITDDQWAHTQPPTATHRQALAWASEAFTEELSRLHRLASDLEDLESRAEAAGAPWTPGRRPAWNR